MNHPTRRLALPLALFALLALGATESASANQRAVSVALGEFSVPPSQRDLLPEVTAAARSALDATPGVRVTAPRRARWVLRGSLTRLHETDGQVRAEVSLIVADRRSGAVRHLIDGRATARGGSTEGRRPGALRAAFAGALRQLTAVPGRTRATRSQR